MEHRPIIKWWQQWAGLVGEIRRLVNKSLGVAWLTFSHKVCCFVTVPEIWWSGILGFSSLFLFISPYFNLLKNPPIFWYICLRGQWLILLTTQISTKLKFYHSSSSPAELPFLFSSCISNFIVHFFEVKSLQILHENI